jgi:hypothetical protein
MFNVVVIYLDLLDLYGFGAHLLPTHRKGEVAKMERERLILALYEQWVLNHPL